MTRIDIGASPRPEPEMTSESGGSSDTEEEVGGGGGRHHTAESHHEDKKVGTVEKFMRCNHDSLLLKCRRNFGNFEFREKHSSEKKNVPLPMPISTVSSLKAAPTITFTLQNEDTILNRHLNTKPQVI